MLGAIIGDIIGSRFEFMSTQETDINYFHNACTFTDDTVCIAAICKTTKHLLDINQLNEKLAEKNSQLYHHEVDYSPNIFANKQYANTLREYALNYPLAGYGNGFMEWVKNPYAQAYNSLGNGCLMRLSPIPFLINELSKAQQYSRYATEVTHNHPEALNAVECYCTLLWHAKNWNGTVLELKKFLKQVLNEYGFCLETVEQYHIAHGFHVLAPPTLLRALSAVLEAENYADTMKNVLYIGSDTDTTGAVAGALAEYIYGIPENYLNSCLKFFTHNNIEILHQVVHSYLINPKNNFGELAKNNLFSQNKIAFYQSTYDLHLEDPTAAWDPLNNPNDNEYYTDIDKALEKQQETWLKKILTYFRL
jgi:ADP-ribosylglycohydrolase